MNDTSSQVVKQLILFGQMLEFIAMITGAVAVIFLLVYLCGVIMLCPGDAHVRRSCAITILPATCHETTSALTARRRITNGEKRYAQTRT